MHPCVRACASMCPNAPLPSACFLAIRRMSEKSRWLTDRSFKLIAVLSCLYVFRKHGVRPDQHDNFTVNARRTLSRPGKSKVNDWPPSVFLMSHLPGNIVSGSPWDQYWGISIQSCGICWDVGRAAPSPGIMSPAMGHFL